MNRTWIVIAMVASVGCAHHHAHHGGIQHDFKDVQHWVKKFDDPTRDEWQKPDAVVEQMRIAPGSRVADIGAGTGYFLPYLNKAVGAKGQVLALDVEDNLVQYMKGRIQREGLTVTQAQKIGYDEPGLSPASVDRVLIVDTWHHIENREDYSRKLAAGLKKNGEIHVVDFDPNADGGPGPGKKHRLPSDKVEKELQAAGLKTRTERGKLPYQYTVIATK